ncbi:MAG: protein TolR [Deltaproteobacteria bacterium]|nr:MAG: protein TolR [Deltaproteobacteria bacterium]
MGFSVNGNGKNLISEINVTPFVDVMLVLLIIFMVTAPMMLQGEKVNLPEAGSGNITREDINWIITITEDKKIYFNKSLVEIGYLQSFLQDKLEKENKSPEVFIKGDKNVPYGMVVSVMSKIKAAGIKNVGMITIPVSSE